jgi:glycosyltransferase involved in cell wall biosynthesis
VGDGDLAREVEGAAAQCPRIRWHGALKKPQVYERMKDAAALIVPSTWYEPFGMVVAEAFARGLPVIASKIGALASMVRHERTGLHFEPANAADLAAQVNRLHNQPQARRYWRDQARLEFERYYTGEQNYSLLMDIYRRTIAAYRSDRCSDRDLVPNNNTLELVQIAAPSAPPSRPSSDLN